MATLVRALTRGLSVLRALGEFKFATPAAIARHTGMPRPTVYRLLDTLMAEGLVVRMPDSDFYRLTSAVWTLMMGFDDETRLVEVAQPLVDELSRKLVWPIDLFTYGNGVPVIRQSTHGASPLSFIRAAQVGRAVSMLGTSAGRAYLASVPEVEIPGVIESQRTDRLAGDRTKLKRMIGEMRRTGYGYRDGGIIPRTCAIAMPVIHGGRPIGAISVMCIRSAMPLAEARERYVPELRDAVTAIESQLRDAASPGARPFSDLH